MNGIIEHDTNRREQDADTTIRRPRAAGRVWLLLLLPLLTLGLIGTAVATGGVAHAATARAPAMRDDGSKLNGTLNVSGVDLELTSVKIGSDTRVVRSLPDRVAASGLGKSSWESRDWSYFSTWAKAAEVEVTYRVVGTPYEVLVRMAVPPLLPNSIGYEVRLASTHERIQPGDEWLSVHVGYRNLGYDPHPVISIQG